MRDLLPGPKQRMAIYAQHEAMGAHMNAIWWRDIRSLITRDLEAAEAFQIQSAGFYKIARQLMGIEE